MTGTPWHKAPIVALDLEASGAQDGDREAIMEIAMGGDHYAHPDVDHAYRTLVNPGRPIPVRPWISPGLTNQAISNAPTLEMVGPALAERLNGCYIVGHNVAVDWCLLHRRYPTIHPAGLIDTLRLARHLNSANNGLARLVAVHDLTAQIDALAMGSQPHRALWDTNIAAAVLLRRLIGRAWPNSPTIGELRRTAGTRARGIPPAATDQPSLFNQPGPTVGLGRLTELAQGSTSWSVPAAAPGCRSGSAWPPPAPSPTCVGSPRGCTRL